MPIFMDRHEVEGATKHAMELAHEKDLALQSDYDVKMMTYWFDEERATAFCLAEAPNADAIRELHAHSHGSIPNEVTEVNPLLVEAFLGRVEDPPSEPGSDSEYGEIEPAYRSIMFTDLKDSTQIAVRFGDEKAMRLIRVHNALTREALRKGKGREVKTTGDGFLLSFDHALDAVECAVSIQESFKAYNLRNPDEKLYVRIGVSSGEPIEEKGDLYGTAVNMASRICDQAKAGGVLVAKVILDEVNENLEKFQFVHVGMLSLKGFEEPVEVFEVRWSG
ncbi:MAG: nickel-binding protein [Candidatus Promineifilaceae bacterium]